MERETKVKCDVKSCKYNEEKECNLEKIDISCSCDGENCEDKCETVCNSFEKNDNELVELEYSVIEN